jgi:hypothetical protein
MAIFKKPAEYQTTNGGPPPEPKTSADWSAFLETLKAKLAAAKTRLGELEAERAEASLAAELGDSHAVERLDSIRSVLEAGERTVEAVELAQERAQKRLREAQNRESDQREIERQQKIMAAKAELVKSAAAFDEACITMKSALDSFYHWGGRVHDLMNPEEQRNFLGARSSVGPQNACGHFRLARGLEMGVAAHPQHHQSLSKYVRQWCGPAPEPPISSTPPPPETLEFKSEAEALGTARPKSL